MRNLLALISLLLAAAPVLAAPAPPAQRLHDLFHREWETQLRENPLTATYVGRHDYDDQLPSMKREDLERRAKQLRGFLGELEAVVSNGRSKLPAEDAVSAEMFREDLEDRLADFELGAWQMPFNSDSGFHTDFAQLPDQMPFQSLRDYENYIQRLRQWPRYVGEQIELMRIGIQRGMTVPREVLPDDDTRISGHIVDDPEKSIFYEPFQEKLNALPAADQERLRREGREAVIQGVVAGFRRFRDFYQNEYLPHARKTVGASELPDGRKFYEQQVRHYTTLDITPEEVHKIGLAEVERIDKEMREVIRQTGFQGDFAAFLNFLRTDPRFYPKSGDELLKDAAWIAKRMDGKLPALFGRLPRLPYTVRPVPEQLAPQYTSGRYVDPPFGSTEPGVYWVNVYKPETRALYNLEALTLHESVPGHHLQISLSRELEGMPEFRRFLYLSAFGEGWGLYSEWLGLEAGFYKDPYSNFGRLTYEMWRACRLVVDTGIHAMGWTRQQALDYLASHTALPLHEVETETDRYISWPGQALAYKMGELKIKELRKKAEAELGPRFDVRAFHDVVLGSGSVPLKVLEQNVNGWIAKVKGKGAGK